MKKKKIAKNREFINYSFLEKPKNNCPVINSMYDFRIHISLELSGRSYNKIRDRYQNTYFVRFNSDNRSHLFFFTDHTNNAERNFFPSPFEVLQQFEQHEQYRLKFILGDTVYKKMGLSLKVSDHAKRFIFSSSLHRLENSIEEINSEIKRGTNLENSDVSYIEERDLIQQRIRTLQS